MGLGGSWRRREERRWVKKGMCLLCNALCVCSHCIHVFSYVSIDVHDVSYLSVSYIKITKKRERILTCRQKKDETVIRPPHPIKRGTFPVRVPYAPSK